MINHAFRFLLVGNSAANIGDVLFIVALMPLIYEQTGSTFLMALVPFLSTGSRFVSAFLAPLLFRRLTLKSIMVWTQGIKTLLLLGLLMYLILFSYVGVLPIYLVILMIGLLDGTASPASGALVPKVVSKDKLLKSNSVLESTSQFIEIAAWPLGAMLVAFFDSGAAMIISIALYSIATLSYICMKAKQKITDLNTEASSSSFKSEVRRGWVFIARRKDLLSITLSGVFISAANIVWIASIIFVYVEEVLRVSSVWWGYMNSLLVFGLFLAGIFMVIWHRKTERFFKVLVILSNLIMAICTFALSWNTLALVAVVLAFLSGFTNQVKALLETTYLQVNIDEENLPYVYAAQQAAYLLTFAVSILFFSLLVDMIGVSNAFVFAGLLLLMGVVCLYMNKEHFLEFETGEREN